MSMKYMDWMDECLRYATALARAEREAENETVRNACDGSRLAEEIDAASTKIGRDARDWAEYCADYARTLWAGALRAAIVYADRPAAAALSTVCDI